MTDAERLREHEDSMTLWRSSLMSSDIEGLDVSRLRDWSLDLRAIAYRLEKREADVRKVCEEMRREAEWPDGGPIDGSWRKSIGMWAAALVAERE